MTFDRDKNRKFPSCSDRVLSATTKKNRQKRRDHSKHLVAKIYNRHKKVVITHVRAQPFGYVLSIPRWLACWGQLKTMSRRYHYISAPNLLNRK